MKRKSKKLLALLLAFAMLMSLSISAFATEDDDEEEAGGDAAVSYSNTSDPFTITNFSNVDVNVKVEVQFSGMTGVTFADNEDCKESDAEDAEVIPDSIYLALLAETTDAVAAAEDAEAEEEDEDESTVDTQVLNNSGYAVVEATIGKAAEGAYEWKVKDKDEEDPEAGKGYVYELRDDLQVAGAAAASAEFSKFSVKMTGALSTEGWKNFTGEPSYTITWTCASTEETTTSRVAYTWTEEDEEPVTVYWDITAKKFYTTADGTTEVTGLTLPDEEEIDEDTGLPVEDYRTENNLEAVASGSDSDDSEVTVYEHGSSTNRVTFEGKAPDNITDFDIPTQADNAFEFILDPNGLIQATEAEMHGGATFDFTKGNGLFFKNTATAAAGGAQNSPLPKVVLVTAATGTSSSTGAVLQWTAGTGAYADYTFSAVTADGATATTNTDGLESNQFRLRCNPLVRDAAAVKVVFTNGAETCEVDLPANCW